MVNNNKIAKRRGRPLGSTKKDKTTPIQANHHCSDDESNRRSSRLKSLEERREQEKCVISNESDDSSAFNDGVAMHNCDNNAKQKTKRAKKDKTKKDRTKHNELSKGKRKKKCSINDHSKSADEQSVDKSKNNSEMSKNSANCEFRPPLPPNSYSHNKTNASSLTPSANKSECDDSPKPEKVKSRWRRNSELESGQGVSVEQHLKLNAHIVQPIVIHKETELPPPFEMVDENIYLFERKKSKRKKETRRMVCDCILTKEERQRGLIGCGDDCLNRMLMIECGSRCSLGEHCANKRFQKKQYAKVESFKTAKKGWGLRAMEPIQPNTFIMEYIGEVIDPLEFHNRTRKYDKDKHQHHYFMALKNDEIIDATMKGNITRFVNHSCDPNSETQKWTVNGELRIGFYSQRFIQAGEEITFDYQFQRYGKEAQKCYCESVNCRGYIGATDAASIFTDGSRITPKQRIKIDYKQKENILEDLALEEEIAKLSEGGGLRSRQQVLMLARLMVRAEDKASRHKLISIIKSTSEVAYLRLFLDYHGLQLVWSWMVDLDDVELKREILEVLELMPIPNKTMLIDSKVLSVVERWSQQTHSEPESQSNSSGVAFEDLNDNSNSFEPQKSDNEPEMEKCATFAAQVVEQFVEMEVMLENGENHGKSSVCVEGEMRQTKEAVNERVRDMQSALENTDICESTHVKKNIETELLTHSLENVSIDESKQAVENELFETNSMIESDVINVLNFAVENAVMESQLIIDKTVTSDTKHEVCDETADNSVKHELLIENEHKAFKDESLTDMGEHQQTNEGDDKEESRIESEESQQTNDDIKDEIRVESDDKESKEVISNEDKTSKSEGKSSSISMLIKPRSASNVGKAEVSQMPAVKPKLSIAAMALKLLNAWNELKEVFRIPRLERQKRHEDEKEADRRTKEVEERRALGLPVSNDKRYADSRDYTIAGILGIKRKVMKRSLDSKESVNNSNKKMSITGIQSNNAMQSPATPVKMSKEEHRKMFEMEVAQRDYHEALKKYHQELAYYNAMYGSHYQQQMYANQPPNVRMPDAYQMQYNYGQYSYPVEQSYMQSSYCYQMTSEPSVEYLPYECEQTVENDDNYFEKQIMSAGDVCNVTVIALTDADVKYTDIESSLSIDNLSTDEVVYNDESIFEDNNSITTFDETFPPPGMYYLTPDNKSYFMPLPVDKKENCVNINVFENIPIPHSSSFTQTLSNNKLPTNWRHCTDKSGDIYYYNVLTRKSQWSPPEEEKCVSPFHVLLSDVETNSNDNEGSNSGAEITTSVSPKTDENDEHIENGTEFVPPDSNNLFTESVSNSAQNSPKVHSFTSFEADPRKRKQLMTSSNSLTTTAAADTSSSVPRKHLSTAKIQDQFRTRVSQYVIHCLNPYMSKDCKQGKIVTTDDFKYLARKLTHFIMGKEIKHCRSIEQLTFNDSVKKKMKDYVRKYMMKFGEYYKPDKDNCERLTASPKDSQIVDTS